MEKLFEILKKVFNVTIDMLVDYAEQDQKRHAQISRNESSFKNMSGDKLIKVSREASSSIDRAAASNVARERLQYYENKFHTTPLYSLENIMKNENKDKIERIAAKNVYKRRKNN